ncbi:cytochrome P450 [Neoconidiobolus thromboides FSU 785]|nr:cytochrome P450 [Neoconidiobolus thromboides FSU 785]
MIEIKSILIIASISLLVYYIYSVIHSLFFCPLRKVPGPLIVHFIPFYYKLKQADGTLHEYALNIHKKYGHTVRIGGDLISVVSDSACKEIHNTYDYLKDGLYEAIKVMGENMLNTNDKEGHRFKKRILAPFFSDKTILSVENVVKENVDNLVNKLEEFSDNNQKFDLGLYFHYFSFDIIGDLGFGKPFNMVKKGYHPVIDWIKDVFRITFLVAAFPALKHFQYACIKSLYQFSFDAINDAKNHPDKVTIMNALINAEDPETGKKLSEKEVAEESMLQIAAGTDTTSNTLTWFFYNLANNPDVYEKVEKEIHSTFPNKGSINYSKVKSECHYLNATIHESMRIKPVAPGVLSRFVPKGGRVIDGYFIPEGTSVGAAAIAKHNLPSLWEDPDNFNPERWLENGKFKNNPNFFPFSIGPRACIGRSLAWMELYLVTATLIRNFRFERENNKRISSKFYMVVQPTEPICYTVNKI